MIDRYAVFGNPVAHSKSPELQHAFAQQTQQDISYTKELIAPNAFEAAIHNFQVSGGKGLNITVPFKLEAFQLADTLTERAKLAQAVNTLIFQPSGEIVGDNTDGAGLVNDMKQTHSWEIKNKRMLILGAGGAVRGTLGPLLDEMPASISLSNRTFSKAQALTKVFNNPRLHAIESFQGLLPFDIIINGTSASLQGDKIDLPAAILSPETRCYDMMYAKDLTPFLAWAKEQGVTQLADGLGMLVHQGAESFRLWRGVTPDTKPILQYLRRILQ